MGFRFWPALTVGILVDSTRAALFPNVQVFCDHGEARCIVFWELGHIFSALGEIVTAQHVLEKEGMAAYEIALDMDMMLGRSNKDSHKWT